MQIEIPKEEILISKPTLIDEKIANTASILTIKKPTVSPGFDLAMRIAASELIRLDQSAKYPFGYSSYLNTELQTKINHYIPTIGVELEIPYNYTPYSYSNTPLSLYRDFAKKLQIPFYDSASNYFEFSLPYSYAARTQALLLHQLIGMGYIPTELFPRELDTWSKRHNIFESHKYSLHCNLGIPNELSSMLYTGQVNVNDLKGDAMILAMICGLSFSSKERLLSRKSDRGISLDREANKSLKTPGIEKYGRVELTPLGLGTLSTFRQLYQIQEIGATLFAYLKVFFRYGKIDEVEENLSTIWQDGRDFFLELFSTNGLTPEIFNGRLEAQITAHRNILNQTNLMKDMRQYVPKLARLASAAMKKDPRIKLVFP